LKRLLHDRKRNKPQIVVTNLIDVVLLLVFFFMITSSFATNKEKLPVNVPKAGNSASIEKDNLSIQVGKNAQVFVAGKVVTLEELQEQVKTWTKASPERPIMLEADEEASYGKIVTVLDHIRNAGGTNLGLTTKPIP
jgi:biopolymer transport protein ExbD